MAVGIQVSGKYYDLTRRRAPVLECTIKGFRVSSLQRSNRQYACQNSARRSSPEFLGRQYTLFVCESCGYKTSKRRANSISSATAHARLLACEVTRLGPQVEMASVP